MIITEQEKNRIVKLHESYRNRNGVLMKEEETQSSSTSTPYKVLSKFNPDEQKIMMDNLPQIKDYVMKELKASMKKEATKESKKIQGDIIKKLVNMEKMMEEISIAIEPYIDKLVDAHYRCDDTKVWKNIEDALEVTKNKLIEKIDDVGWAKDKLIKAAMSIGGAKKKMEDMSEQDKKATARAISQITKAVFHQLYAVRRWAYVAPLKLKLIPNTYTVTKNPETGEVVEPYERTNYKRIHFGDCHLTIDKAKLNGLITSHTNELVDKVFSKFA